MTEFIQDTLRSLGITRCYRGFNQTTYAIYLAVTDDSRLELVTKCIYMETATHFHCKWNAVERNIRTVAARAWQFNPGLLSRMAGYPLTGTPSASQFIEIIVSFILRSGQQPANSDHVSVR